MNVVAEKAGCALVPATRLPVYKYVIIESITSGNWTNPSTWDCDCVPLRTDNVRINASHTVGLTTGGSGTEVHNFIIESGGELDPNNRKMTIHSNFELDGTYLGGSKDLTMDGFGKYVDGVGNLEQGIIFAADIYFATTADIDITSGDIEVAAGINVSNYGSVKLSDNLVGLNAASSWSNNTNASLKVGGTLFSGNGILDAFTFGNSVSISDRRIRPSKPHNLPILT